MTITVVKVGGSLFDLVDLGSRLGRFLKEFLETQIVLIPGGGPTTDLIRTFDRRFNLGEEKSHWLALRALTLNAEVLASLMPTAVVVSHLDEMRACWRNAIVPIVDAHAFLSQRESSGVETLPHLWEAGSDTIALVVAQALAAQRLILLKSVDAPEEIDWFKASQDGLVDPHFPRMIEASARVITIEVRNLRGDSLIE